MRQPGTLLDKKQKAYSDVLVFSDPVCYSKVKRALTSRPEFVVNIAGAPIDQRHSVCNEDFLSQVVSFT